MADRDGDRPKKSWREIDSRRDRSGSGSSSSSSSSGSRRDEGGGQSRSAADRASRQYRAALEALFDKGGVGKVAEKLGASSLAPASNQAQSTPTPATGTPRATAPIPAADAGKQALRKKVLEAIGRDAITRVADKYLKEYSLPEDWELLEQIVEHRDDDRVREVLAALNGMLDRERPKRSRLLGAKLRFIEETSDDRELRALAAAVRARLG